MSEWIDARLGDLLQVKHGYAFPGEDFSDELTGRPIIVSIGNFDYAGGFGFENSRVRECRGLVPQDYVLAPDDVLVVMTCQTQDGAILGVPGRIPNDGRVYLHNQRLGKLIVQRPDVLDLSFVYWLMLAPSTKQYLYATASGSKILHTAPTRIEAMRFMLPPLPEQRAIAGVLGALDYKIKSNRKLTGLIKSLSELLLRRSVGDPIGGPNESDGDARSVQIGSEEIAIVSPGLEPTGSVDEFEYLATADVFDNRYEPGTVGLKAALPSRANMRPGSDRVWFARMKATSKSLWTPTEASEKWARMVLSTGFMGLKAVDPRLGPLLMTGIRCIEFEEIKDQLCNGTTMQSLNNESARDIAFRVPIDEFRLTELSSEIRLNLLMELRINEQSAVLGSMRDALLPELLSGRLRVRDAETVVEGVL